MSIAKDVKFMPENWKMFEGSMGSLLWDVGADQNFYFFSSTYRPPGNDRGSPKFNLVSSD